MNLKTDPDGLGFLLGDTARLVRGNFERRIASLGLQITTAEARALIFVAANKGARQTVIAERMNVEPMTLCGYLDRLEKAGLVSRHPDASDRRAKNVRTTDAADATIAAIRGTGRVMVDHAQAGLNADERAALTKALLIVRGNLMEMLLDRDEAPVVLSRKEMPV
ncbi:MarR family winged helix-turn-helix transcriptional regulator [Rhizobium sp.]